MAALEAGYFPEHEIHAAAHEGDAGRAYIGRHAESMTPAALYDAIEAEIRGSTKRYPGGWAPDAVIDQGRDDHDRTLADAELARQWRELAEIAERDGSGEAWRYLVAKANIDTEIPF